MLRRDSVLRGGLRHLHRPYGHGQHRFYQPGYTATQHRAEPDNGLTFEATTQNPFPGGLLAIAGTRRNGDLPGAGHHLPPPGPADPYMQRWNVSLPAGVPFRMMADFGYIGSRGVGLQYSSAVNAIPAQYLSTSPVRDQTTINYLSQNVANPFYNLSEFTAPAWQPQRGRSQLLRPYRSFPASPRLPRTDTPGITPSGASRKALSAGFTTTVSFTWSKSMEAVTKLNESDRRPTARSPRLTVR